MTDTRRYTILVADDDDGVRHTLAELVEQHGFRPILAADGDQALEIVESEPIHLALFDMQMPKLTGLETLQLARQVNALLPAILITAETGLTLLREAFNAQVFSVLPKPVDGPVVVRTVIRALVRVYGSSVEPPTQTDMGETTR